MSRNELHGSIVPILLRIVDRFRNQFPVSKP